MESFTANSALQIEEISDEGDFVSIFEVCSKAFGEQTADGIWTTLNPGWDTVDGKRAGAARMADDWRKTKSSGHKHYIKASLDQRIVGVAIWVNTSLVEGCGHLPDPHDYTKLYPNDPSTAKFLAQILGSLTKNRTEVLQSKARDSTQKSVMTLDLCAVDPAYQRRGIANQLVQWGLDEAKRLGDLEAVTEASVMGRSVYKKMGFYDMGEIEYVLDEEFRSWSQPSNVFLRTKPELGGAMR